MHSTPIEIPQVIRERIGDAAPVTDETGMSSAQVSIYPSCVLKIQERSAETDNEVQVARSYAGAFPMPEILEYVTQGKTAYTLMSRVQGEMLCAPDYRSNPHEMIRLMARAIKLLWNVDIKETQGRTEQISRLQERLKQARYNVENGLVDLGNVEPETFGPGGFDSPEDLLNWLETNQLPEDLVFTHGDMCLPNIFTENGEITGIIDLGKAGPADRWQDIAIAIRSLHHNLTGYYDKDGEATGSHCDFKPEELLDSLGIPLDEAKYRYYLLLDELF